MKSKSFDEYFIRMAMLVSEKSKDPSTKVGCVIVGPDNEIRSTGFNGFPRGVDEEGMADHHIPIAVETDVAARDYIVRCRCSKVLRIPRQEYECMPDNVKAFEQHEHFKEPEFGLIAERWERPAKYAWIEHAERNAVYNAARIGTALKGCKAYLNWEPRPCVDCCRGFIQAGIVEVIGPDIQFPSSGKDWKFELSQTMMFESGVNWREVEWPDKK